MKLRLGKPSRLLKRMELLIKINSRMELLFCLKLKDKPKQN